MKTVAVIGGAGFIGYNLVSELIAQDIKVKVVDDLSTGNRIHEFADYLIKDISEIGNEELTEYLKDVDVVFLTAALARVQPSIKDPQRYNKVNVDGTLNVLLACHKAGVKRVVYSASSSCYGETNIFPTPETAPTNSLSPYGLQKYIGEQYCKMFSEVYGLDTVSLRYFNVYGEYMNTSGAYCLAMGIFTNQLMEGKPLTITNDGNQRRDFTYVKDVVQANILAATHPEPLKGESFNIGNGKNYSINEVADMMGGEKQYGEKRLEPFQTLADNSKARKILGWEPKGDLPTWLKSYVEELNITQ